MSVERTCRTVAAFRASIDGQVDGLRDPLVLELQMRWLIVLMVGSAAVQRRCEVKADLPIWLGVLPGLEIGSWSEGFMIRLPAKAIACMVHYTGN